MTEQYHDAPHTLDSEREIPEDAPPSAGHDDEGAAVVRERGEKFTEGLKDEPDEAVGPREPGDDAGDDAGDDDSEDYDEDPDVPDGTVNEVLDWVGDDHERAQRALQVERSGQNRQTLVTELEKR
jgi:hypothetical protein